MTDKEIFTKTMEKLHGSEYSPGVLIIWINNLCNNNTSEELTSFNAKVRAIIFSHDFAKSFWGEKKMEGILYNDNHFAPNGDDLHGVELRYDGFEWQYHLQQMVLEKEPLKYLEKFL